MATDYSALEIAYFKAVVCVSPTNFYGSSQCLP